MKKILNIRNILIFFTIVVAIIYISFMRTKRVEKSKTNELFYELINKDIVTMSISFKEKNKNGNIIFSTDKSNDKTVEIIEIFDEDENAKRNNTTHIKSIVIREKKRIHTYQINYDLNKYTDFGENEEKNSITEWIEDLNNIVTKSKYYVKGYKKITNSILYTETFKELGYKFYYDGNELKYIQQKDGFSGNENTLYYVSIEDNFIDNSLLKIPNNFILSN